MMRLTQRTIICFLLASSIFVALVVIVSTQPKIRSGFQLKNNPLNLETPIDVPPNVAINTVIPLNIFQTCDSKNLPAKMKQCIQSISIDNPEFNHYLYNDDECRTFIETYFDVDILNAYDTLVPGAFKADLWRYCVLYKYGGIYIDIKYKCVGGFKFLSLTDDEYFVKDLSIKEAVYNALIVAKAGNLILKQCIEQVVNNVKNRFYGTDSLEVTGPKMVIKFLSPMDIMKLPRLNHVCDKDNKFFIDQYNVHILQFYDGYRNDQISKPGFRSYGSLWAQRKIYQITNST